MTSSAATLRAALHSLELRARQIVEGLRAGGHASPRPGGNVEFDRHRAYQPGDPIRHLDWKVFARSDRLVLKHARMETTLDVLFVLDVSGSMAFGSDGEWGTKADLARVITRALAWLAVDSGDRVSCWACPGQDTTVPPPRSGPTGLAQVVASSDAPVQSGTVFDPTAVAVRLTDALSRPHLVILVSDCFVDPTTLGNYLARLRHAGHDVMVLQIMDKAERELSLPSEARLVDLEQIGIQHVQTKAIREDYLTAVAEHLGAIRERCDQLHVDLAMFDPHKSPIGTLQALLNTRRVR